MSSTRVFCTMPDEKSKNNSNSILLGQCQSQDKDRFVHIGCLSLTVSFRQRKLEIFRSKAGLTSRVTWSTALSYSFARYNYHIESYVQGPGFSSLITYFLVYYFAYLKFILLGNGFYTFQSFCNKPWLAKLHLIQKFHLCSLLYFSTNQSCKGKRLLK